MNLSYRERLCRPKTRKLFCFYQNRKEKKCPQHCLRHQRVSAGSSVSSQAILSAAGAKEPKSTTQSVRSHTLGPRDALRASICRVTFQIAAEMQSTVSVSVASLHWAAFETVHSTDSWVSTSFLTIIIVTAAAVYFVQKKESKKKKPLHRMRSILGHVALRKQGMKFVVSRINLITPSSSPHSVGITKPLIPT